MKKKLFTLALSSTVLLTGALAGCGGNNEETTPEASKPAAENSVKEPTKISLSTINYGAEAPANDNAIELEMEKRTNTKLDITYVPSNNYGDKFQVMLASGQIPDVLLTTWIYDAAVLNAIDSGAFWDLTPFLKDYPNIAKTYPKESIDNSKVDGKVYGLPRPRPLVGGAPFPMLRQDWLTKLGLEMPTTMDELYTVLKAFTEQDPDGNGKKDTYGFSSSVAEGWMDKLEFVEDVFNGYNGFYVNLPGEPTKVKDFEPATRDAILWLQKAYKEGVMAPDFAIMESTQVIDMMKQGKLGMMPSAMDSKVLGEILQTLSTIAPDAALEHVPTLVSPATGEKYAIKEGGFFGNYLISKKVPEEKVKKILEFFDYGATPEGMELANFGLKDVHFTETDGVKVVNEEFTKLAGKALSNIWTNVDPYSRIVPAPGYPTAYFERDKKVIAERIENGVYINNSGVSSETDTKVGPEIGKKIQDMKIKVIMGKEPIESWDKLVETMKKDANLNKILVEREASYKELFGAK
ncbi:extracellular solute-binding protein [Paenibacillus wynnii]|uniref:ABC transporter substrate-binding protein n=1 Tax=Paenibacillus wynnii TaxID=268407 RepID=A0A098M8A3_9BACL|nr:extracellular solute-binding protein [Paenibacillus wynnii]KGE18770.1 ABC transporter substrate-binding protein [Paenibacillus wynnii]